MQGVRAIRNAGPVAASLGAPSATAGVAAGQDVRRSGHVTTRGGSAGAASAAAGRPGCGGRSPGRGTKLPGCGSRSAECEGDPAACGRLPVIDAHPIPLTPTAFSVDPRELRQRTSRVCARAPPARALPRGRPAAARRLRPRSSRRRVVDDRQSLQRPAVARAVGDEIRRPHLVRRQGPASGRRSAKTASCGAGD